MIQEIMMMNYNDYNDLVECTIFYETSTLPVKRKGFNFISPASEVERILSNYQKEIGKDYFETEKYIFKK